MDKATASPAMPQDQVRRKVVWLDLRWLIALAGLVFLVIGQFRLSSELPPQGPPLPAGIWLTETIHLSDPGIDNVLNGLPLLLTGAALLAIALHGIPLVPTQQDLPFIRPIPHGPFASVWPWVLAGAATFALLLSRINSDSFIQYQVPLWLISLACIGTVAAHWDRRHEVDLSPHLTRSDWRWLFGLLLVGFVIGTYRLQGLPDSLIGDEGNFWTIARDIAKGGFSPSLFAPGVYTFPVFSSILQAWIIKLFGIDLWGWRFSSVFMGLVTVPPLYLLARDAFDRKVAIASSAALIVSPYFLAFSRLGYNNIQALFFTTLTLYWLYTGIARKSNLYLYLAGCAAGFGFYTYFAARGALIISLAFLFLIWLSRKIKLRDAGISTAWLLAGCLLVVLPHFVYGYVRDPEGMGFKAWESIFINTFNGLQFYTPEELFAVAPPFEVNGNELFYHPQIYLVLIVRGLLRTLLAFQKPWLISEHFIAFPLAGTLGVIFYLVGLAVTVWTLRQPRSLLLLLWFLANVIGLSALNTVPPRHTHMVAILPALALMTGLGINALASAAAAMHFKLQKYKTHFLAGLIALTAVGGLHDYFVVMPGRYLPQPDQFISWAILDSRNEKFVYLFDNPDIENIKPYVASEFRDNVSFETVDIQEVLDGRVVLSNQPTVVFMPFEYADRIREVLEPAWGGDLQTMTFLHGDGAPAFAAAMNTPFVFERGKDLSTILADSYSRPSLWILLAILGLGLAVSLLLPAGWTVRTPAPLQRLADWFNAPAPARPPEPEPSEWTEEILAARIQQRAQTHPAPPAWTQDENFSPAAPAVPASDRARAHFKRVQTEGGVDYFIKVHLPLLKLPALDRLLARDTEGGPAFSLPPIQVPNPIRLTAAVLLAVAAQTLIGSGLPAAGALAYLASAAGLYFWARHNPAWTHVFARQLRISARSELLLLLALGLLVIFTRFYDLNSRVYGLEADETKWTVQSWYSTILMQDIGEFSSMHYQPLPVDFWVRSFFLRLFGLNFLSARIESATLSVIAVLALYLLVRRLTASPPAALLSALLFGFSFIELNASHQALHNTPPMAWSMAALCMFFYALRDRKSWQFQAAGILLALGMLTYETFYPTVMAAILYLTGLAGYEVSKKRASIKDWLSNAALLVWPVLLVYLVFSRGYLAGRQYYLFGSLWSSTADGRAVIEFLGYLLNNTVDALRTTFAGLKFSDSLIFWTGPLINPLLLPFIVIGLAYNLWNLRKPHFAFIPLWYLLHTLAGPILLGSAWPRVMYLAVPPLMIWGALGLWTALGALRGLFDHQSVRLTGPAFALLVLAILVNDYRIFTTRLLDPDDRQKRRELSDLTIASAETVDRTIYPFVANQGDAVDAESHVLLYSVAGARGLGLEAAGYYQLAELDQVMPTLWKYRVLDDLDLIFDQTPLSFLDERATALEVILRCYPAARLEQRGRYFDLYRFESKALKDPACYSPEPPAPISPADSDAVKSDEPVAFTWDARGTSFQAFELKIERKRAGVDWIEAEDVFTGPGWPAVSGFVDGFNGYGFLLDEWHSGEALYTYDVPQDGEYRVWIRSYKRRPNDQYNFIELAGQKMGFAENTDVLDTWVWKDLGTFQLAKGQLPIILTRTYGVDDQYSVFIDNLVISSDLAFNPETDGLWKTVMTTPEAPASGSEHTLDYLLPPGEYRWAVRIFDGGLIVSPDGTRGSESAAAVFRVVP